MMKMFKQDTSLGRLIWALSSLVLAVLIWTYMTGTGDEYITVDFNDVPLTMEGATLLQESRGFVVTEMETDRVDISLYGKRTDIGWMTSSDIQAVVDLTRITKSGESEITYELVFPPSVSSEDVTILSKTPSAISLIAERIVTKTVPVRGAFSGTTPDEYVVEEPTFEPSTITLSGPDTQLENVDHVWATMDGEDLTKTRSADVSYVYMDADGNQLEYTDLTADYDTIEMTVPISLTKEVVLGVSLVTGAGASSTNTIVTVEPSTIRIAGDSSIVEGMNTILVATIDLADFEQTHEDSYTIVLDNDIRNITGITEATVKIEVLGLATERMNITNISYINAPESRVVEAVTQQLSVVIRASEGVLEDIEPENLRAVADLSDISTTGDVSVPVQIFVDGFTNSGAIGDYNITVNIS